MLLLAHLQRCTASSWISPVTKDQFHSSGHQQTHRAGQSVSTSPGLSIRSGHCLQLTIARGGVTEIAPELTGHGLPLSKCEA
jgi:hypothetical protein